MSGRFIPIQRNGSVPLPVAGKTLCACGVPGCVGTAPYVSEQR